MSGQMCLVCLVVVVAAASGRVSAVEAPKVVPKWDIFEVSLTSNERFGNPFTEASVRATFTSSAGKRIEVAGFYYGGKEWRVRFVPRKHGAWKYSVSMKTPRGEREMAAGTFECKGTCRRGSLRISTKNPYRLEYEDETPFYPIGLQTCGYFQTGFDGPTPEGKWRTAPAQEWCKAFEGAVNLIRWQLGAGTKDGCALPLIPKDAAADRYDTELAAKMDDLLALQKTHGFSHIMILFQDMSLWGNPRTAFGRGRDLAEYKSVRAKNLPMQEAYLRYVVARFACYVDVWELFNEDSWAPNEYLAHLAKVIRDADPYDRLITTNYARPKEKWCDIVTWHEYMGMPPHEVDAYVTQEIAKYKSYGKVVLNTEFGNQGTLSNFDPVKWRIAVWTAFMNESSLLFWSTSGRIFEGGKIPWRGNANAYLGAESRRYFRVLANFSRDMPVDMKPVPIGYHLQNDVRTWALSNGKVTAIYVHHFSDHAKEFKLRSALFVGTGPGKFRARWINPADGKFVGPALEVETPSHYVRIAVPPVKVDLACRMDRLE